MCSVNLYESLLIHQRLLDIIFDGAEEYNILQSHAEDFRKIVKLILNSFYGRACIACDKTDTYYREQYAYDMIRKLCKSEIQFGDVVKELFEKDYADTDSCHKEKTSMELYGEYQKAINKYSAAYRKEEMYSCIPFIIERIKNEKKN